MKRKISYTIICIVLILLVFMGYNFNKSNNVEITVDAKVMENDLENKRIIVRGMDNSSILQVGDNCVVSCEEIKIFNKAGEEVTQEEIKAENIVTIMYDGTVLETYPARITSAQWIQIKE